MMLIDAAEVRRLAAKMRDQAPRRYVRGGPILGLNSILIVDRTPPTRAEITEMSGAMVIKTNGLPEGFIPPSASLSPPGGLGQTAAEAAVSLKVALGGCPHGLAEPVTLITGEVVAAVCPTCLEALPASFVGSDWKP